MNTDFYFPTPIWWLDTDIDNAPIAQLCNNLRAEDLEGRQISNNGGWQSKDFKLQEHDEVWKQICVALKWQYIPTV